MEVGKDTLTKFIQQCLKLESVDFHDIAYSMNMSWTRDFKPLLQEPWAKEALEDMLEKMKFKLINRLYTAAVKGVPAGKVPPPAAHIKEMIKIIDSGLLLGKQESGEEGAKEPAMSEEEERRHKKRLGLGD